MTFQAVVGGMCRSHGKERFSIIFPHSLEVITLKGPITTAADDKFFNIDIFPNFQKNKV